MSSNNNEEIRISRCDRFPRYLASTDGEVYRERKDGSLKRLNPTINDRGYRVVNIRRIDGQTKLTKVCALVAGVFIGPRPAGLFVLHGDDIKKNDNISNIRYGTHLDNVADAVRNDRYARGERNGRSRYSDATIGTVKALLARGMTTKAVAADTGVPADTVRSIRAGDTRRDRPEPATGP